MILGRMVAECFTVKELLTEIWRKQAVSPADFLEEDTPGRETGGSNAWRQVNAVISVTSQIELDVGEERPRKNSRVYTTCAVTKARSV